MLGDGGGGAAAEEEEREEWVEVAVAVVEKTWLRREKESDFLFNELIRS